jgi:hypothetical protein
MGICPVPEREDTKCLYRTKYDRGASATGKTFKHKVELEGNRTFPYNKVRMKFDSKDNLCLISQQASLVNLISATAHY